LAHHRGGNLEMNRRRTTLFFWFRIQLGFNCRRVIDNAQVRAGSERTESPRMLRTWRMMNEFRRITFDDSIRVVDSDLMLIDQQPIVRRITFEQGNGSFYSPDPTYERSREQG